MSVSTVSGQAPLAAPVTARAARMLIPAALLLLALMVRLIGIDRHPLWLDEAYSLWYARLDLATLWGVVPRFEPHPPFYYTLLHGWTAVLGETEAALRSLTALVNALAVIPVFLAGRLLGGPGRGTWAGAAAALVFALMPLQLEWSHNARPYGLTALPVAVLLYGLLRLSGAPGVAAVPLWRQGAEGGRVPWGAWLGMALASAMLLWLHNSYPLMILTVQGLALVWWLTVGGRDRHIALNWVAVHAGAFLLWAPWLPNLLHMIGLVGDGYVIPVPQALALVSHLADFLTVNDLWKLRSPWALADLAFVGLGATGLVWLLRTGRWSRAVLLAGIVAVPLALYVGISLVWVPVYQPKLLAWTGVPVALAVGLGVAVLPGRTSRIVMLALVSVGMAAALAEQMRAPPREDWNRAAALLAEERRAEEPVLSLSMSTPLALGYYLERRGADIPIVSLPAPWPNGWKGFAWIGEADRDRIRAVLRGAPRVWLIERIGNFGDDDRRIVRSVLDSYGRRVSARDVGGVRILLYRAAPPIQPAASGG